MTGAGGCGWWWLVRVAGVVVAVEAGQGCRWGVHAGAGVVVPGGWWMVVVVVMMVVAAVASPPYPRSLYLSLSLSLHLRISLSARRTSNAVCQKHTVSSPGALRSYAWPSRLGAPGCRAETGDHVQGILQGSPRKFRPASAGAGRTIRPASAGAGRKTRPASAGAGRKIWSGRSAIGACPEASEFAPPRPGQGEKSGVGAAPNHSPRPGRGRANL